MLLSCARRYLDGHFVEVVDIEKMQYGFMSGRGTVVVFVPRRLSEKLLFIFFDLEEAFD